MFRLVRLSEWYMTRTNCTTHWITGCDIRGRNVADENCWLVTRAVQQTRATGEMQGPLAGADWPRRSGPVTAAREKIWASRLVSRVSRRDIASEYSIGAWPQDQ